MGDGTKAKRADPASLDPETRSLVSNLRKPGESVEDAAQRLLSKGVDDHLVASPEAHPRRKETFRRIAKDLTGRRRKSKESQT